MDEGPTLARLIGFAGCILVFFSVVVVVATRVTGTPRMVSEGWGFIAGAFGLVMLLYHSATDDDQDIRRSYGGFAAFLLLVALFFSVVPGPFEGGTSKQAGYYFLPWGVAAGLLGLLFSIPFTRHETDEVYRRATSWFLLVIGGLLAVGSVLAGVFVPDFMAGPGIPLAILGIGFLCVYMGLVDTADGQGYTTAFALGVVGALTVAYAIDRTAFMSLLYDGPAVLRRPNGSLDTWKVVFRIIYAIAFLVPFIISILARSPRWLQIALGVFGILGAGVVLVSCFSNPVHAPPMPFLVPGGLIMIGIGLVYLAIGLGVCSDNQFVILTRRELSAYFFSPVGYLVLGGMAACEWMGYREFYEELSNAAKQGAAFPEPIVRYYLFSLIPILAVILAVPAITMRLLAEEKRTGSLEVLLTAPVNEWPIVLSKFFATWLFFMICWIPAGLFLVGLRIEGGQPFDYRPILSFYVAVGSCGAAFISAGLFFSAITRNQIVAAVLTFTVMLGLLECYFAKTSALIGPTVQLFLSRVSFIDIWLESLKGQLPLRDLIVWVSAAIFGLFLSVKSLELRKWS
jgi:ABC-type transport system involved in multi-copper enzyme maturation permease subunit